MVHLVCLCHPYVETTCLQHVWGMPALALVLGTQWEVVLHWRFIMCSLYFPLHPAMQPIGKGVLLLAYHQYLIMDTSASNEFDLQHWLTGLSASNPDPTAGDDNAWLLKLHDHANQAPFLSTMTLAHRNCADSPCKTIHQRNHPGPQPQSQCPSIPCQYGIPTEPDP